MIVPHDVTLETHLSITGFGGKLIEGKRFVRDQSYLEALSLRDAGRPWPKPTFWGKPRLAWMGLDEEEVHALLQIVHAKDNTAKLEWSKYLSARMKR